VVMIEIPRPLAKFWSLKTQYGSSVFSFEKHSGQKVHGKSAAWCAAFRDSSIVCVVWEMFALWASLDDASCKELCVVS
jgi:hypothetical protein